MILFCFVHVVLVGDVISGTTSSGIHHSGMLEGWFGVHWWTGRTFVIVFTTLAVFAPLVSLKRIGE
jgi:sodium-coupled neutral amino acid transporter 2